MHYLNEQNIFLFLIQIFLLLGIARGLGELFRKWKQPPLTAEILTGIFLGPTIFGRFLPTFHQIVFPPDLIQQNMLETVAWLGVLFLLLETGLEVDFSSAWRQRGDALKIALSDIIVPMIIAFIPCLFLPDYYLTNPDQKLIFAFFMATVLTISAMPIAARALHDLNLSKTDLGFLIMSALSVNDFVGWLLFTVVLGFFTQAHLDVLKIIIISGSTIGFTALCLTAGRNFSNYVISKIRAKQMPEPGASLTFICLLGLLCGAVTQRIGIHALFGFFVAGIMAGEARALSERTRQVISQMVYAIFVPLFFAGIGLKMDFLKNFDIFLVLFISIIGVLGRFFGAWLGVNFTKLSKANRLSIAVAHTPGGAMEIVVGVLALEYRLISEPVFVAIVFGAVISSIILGPWLAYSLKRRKKIGVLEFFSRRAIVAKLSANTAEKAIYRLCEIAAEQDSMVDVENLHSIVKKREDVMGTAIEEGVALPHARLVNLGRSIVVFGRSVPGIEWNSPDGKSTHFIFLVVVPQGEDEIQVQILRAIAQVMTQKLTRDAIMRAKEIQDIWSTLNDAFTSYHITKNGKTGKQKKMERVK